MQYRIIQHSRDDKIWFTAEIKKFFIWFNVKEDVDMGEFSSSSIVTFTTIEECTEYMKKRYSRYMKNVVLEDTL